MSWKSFVLQNIRGPKEGYTPDENGVFKFDVDKTASYTFHADHTKGAHLRKLKATPFHQIYWETPYYTKVLDRFLADADLSSKVILDFGCGDGRFTQYLIERGAQMIVCVDFDYNTLASLSEFGSQNQLNDRMLIIHSDFDNFNASEDCFDLILSIGVLYYLNEKYEHAIQRFSRMLKAGGTLVTSDPELEGSLLRMLLYESLGEAIRTFQERRFRETKADTGFRFRIFDEREWVSIFEEAGLIVKDKHSISLFHNLVRVLMLRGVISEKDLTDNEAALWEIFDYLHEHGKLSKHLMWKLQKK